MINEKETLAKFGYLSSDLSHASHKHIIVTCETCGEDREVEKHVGVKSIVCLRCQRVNQAKKIATQNRFGRKHSEETKERIRQSNLRLNRSGERSPSFGKKRDEKHRNAIAAANRKRVWTAESRAKLSASHKGKKIAESTKKIWSQQRIGQGNHRYGKPVAHGKGEWYVKKDGARVWLRSGWEVKLANYFDRCSYVWDYESKVYPITYQHKNAIKQGSYRPDFVISCSTELGYRLVEVKGYWRDDAKSKFEAFKEQYPSIPIQLFEKRNLQELGIL